MWITFPGYKNNFLQLGKDHLSGQRLCWEATFEGIKWLNDKNVYIDGLVFSTCL